MTTELIDCPSCGTKLKNGLLSSVRILLKNEIEIIRAFHDKKSEAYCTKCGTELFNKYKSKILEEQDDLHKSIQSVISAVPVVSLQNPLNWDYEVIGMVTGQSTTGTGVISEFTASFSDLFGVQSNKFNKKLKNGEDLCFAQIRKQALDLGGNAVIATDIDYNEVGSEKGMLMVCMAGTAINLKNTELLGQQRSKDLEILKQYYKRLSYLNTFDTNKYIPN
jgi:uncharacterized protein YbjQ (UPF0145 family)/DNA-directed RNA polymerase subunit RPC12/RpoP